MNFIRSAREPTCCRPQDVRRLAHGPEDIGALAGTLTTDWPRLASMYSMEHFRGFSPQVVQCRKYQVRLSPEDFPLGLGHGLGVLLLHVEAGIPRRSDAAGDEARHS